MSYKIKVGDTVVILDSTDIITNIYPYSTKDIELEELGRVSSKDCKKVHRDNKNIRFSKKGIHLLEHKIIIPWKVKFTEHRPTIEEVKLTKELVTYMENYDLWFYFKKVPVNVVFKYPNGEVHFSRMRFNKPYTIIDLIKEEQ